MSSNQFLRNPVRWPKSVNPYTSSILIHTWFRFHFTLSSEITQTHFTKFHHLRNRHIKEEIVLNSIFLKIALQNFLQTIWLDINGKTKLVLIFMQPLKDLFSFLTGAIGDIVRDHHFPHIITNIWFETISTFQGMSYSFRWIFQNIFIPISTMC